MKSYLEAQIICNRCDKFSINGLIPDPDRDNRITGQTLTEINKHHHLTRDSVIWGGHDEYTVFATKADRSILRGRIEATGGIAYLFIERD